MVKSAWEREAEINEVAFGPCVARGNRPSNGPTSTTVEIDAILAREEQTKNSRLVERQGSAPPEVGEVALSSKFRWWGFRSILHPWCERN